MTSTGALRGHVTVVTGASRGIGEAIARRVAEEGSDLFLVARDERRLHDVARRIEAEHGVRALVRAVDLAAPGSTAELGATVDGELGRIDGLVNNAGVVGPVGRIDTTDPTAWMHALATNVGGVMAMTRACVPVMARTGGSIVNLSGGGVGGAGVEHNVSAYTTSKAAIATLTETLAAELEPLDIRVNCIAPGPVATAFLEPVLEAGPATAGDALFANAGSPDRPSEPSDRFLAFVVHLLSPRSRATSGRLLSARWDSPADLDRLSAEGADPSMYRMRRIDGVLFGPERDPHAKETPA